MIHRRMNMYYSLRLVNFGYIFTVLLIKCIYVCMTGGYFVHENTEVDVKIGDVVNYWVYLNYLGPGYQLLDQSWTASGKWEWLLNSHSL